MEGSLRRLYAGQDPRLEGWRRLGFGCHQHEVGGNRLQAIPLRATAFTGLEVLLAARDFVRSQTAEDVELDPIPCNVGQRRYEGQGRDEVWRP